MPSAIRSRPRQLSLFDETPFWDQASLEAAIDLENRTQILATAAAAASGVLRKFDVTPPPFATSPSGSWRS